MEPFVYGTWNIGPRGTSADLAGLVDVCDVVALSEAGDQEQMVRRTLPDHWGLCTGPRDWWYELLAFDRRALEVRQRFAVALTPATKVGEEGAGGPWTGAKYVVGGVFRHRSTGRRVVAGSVHYTPSWRVSLIRRRLVRRQAERTATWAARQDGLVFVGGDFNLQPGSRLLGPLRTAGLVNNHATLGGFPTHEHGSLDHVWWADKPWRARAVAHKPVATGSDHRAVVVTFELRPRG